jgi:hypothetical protein
VCALPDRFPAMVILPDGLPALSSRVRARRLPFRLVRQVSNPLNGQSIIYCFTPSPGES